MVQSATYTRRVEISARGTTEEMAGLAEDLARWVSAGLISLEQAEAILAQEHKAREAAAPAAGEPLPRRIPAVSEALGYLGGVLVLVGIILVATRSWPDLTIAARLTLSGTVAVVLVVAGALVHENADPAFARLRWSLWSASTAAAAIFAGVLTADSFNATPETVVVFSSGTVALQSGILWWNRERPVQQLALLAGTATFVGAVIAEVAGSGPIGLAVWATGASYVALGIGRRTPLPLLTETAGAATVIVGALVTVGEWAAFGLPFTMFSAFGLLALATTSGAVSDRGDERLLGIIGGVALLQALPSTLAYFSQDAAGLTGLAAWAVGVFLLSVGMRGLVHTPEIAEVLGSAGAIGGAALTAGEWQGFAPVFGIATAVTIVALGMLPGQVLLSLLGSAGLLINVPWAIGHFFPGQGRVPLLIAVSGALIFGVAVLLTRTGSPKRRGRTTPPAHDDPKGPT